MGIHARLGGSLGWVNMLEQRKANIHAQQKEKAHQQILCSCSSATLTVHPSSLAYVHKNQLEEEIRGNKVDEGDAVQRGTTVIASRYCFLSYHCSSLVML